MANTVQVLVPRFVKRPGENRVQTFDLAPVLAAGATVSSPNVVCTKQDRVTGSSGITPNTITASGAKVQALFPGGTDEEDYLVTVTAQVSTGGDVTEYFLLMCRDALVP